ncbi:MAG: penicillin-binding transpeptidase domain-containing protein [Draconibacterium sp.]|nr:penicillin-binding transpeptidase domain-containing protein [Draconibacterium sp.]
MEIRRVILTRITLIYFILLVFAIVVIVKMVSVQKIKNDRWEEIQQNLSENTIIVNPDRGNICADDGSVLATSVPGYFVRIDLASEGVRKVFNTESDSLAYYLSRFFGNASYAEHNRRLNEAYKSKNRGFMLTPRKIDYTELQQLKKFPILRRGRYGGGLIIEQENRRVNPLGMLALRTLGGLNKGAFGGVHGAIGYTGLEGSFEPYLKGKDGISFKQNLSGRWVTRVEIEPEDGMDIISTINVKMQDITESALYKQLQNANADWATAILMEVKTGEIKAIANLGKQNGDYFETDNFALGPRGCYEPGSTFKLVSLMVALEDGLVDTSNVFDTGNGQWYKNGRKISDTHGYGKLTVKQIFENSSNIGVAKIITSCYENNPKKYVDRVYSFGINRPLGLDINGEGQPYFKYPGDADWWGTTLAGMSYGYETKMTPLQILNFYNAVANNGKMVKPHLVREVRENGALVKKYKTEVLNPMIASKETIRKAQAMLVGVCINGTGKSINSEYFNIAGKTGTARVATSSEGYSSGMYLASFAGYFPADNPIYSLIVTFNNPRGGYYGASVAGPVFKEIAEKVFAFQTLIDEPEEDEDNQKLVLPDIKKGQSEDIMEVISALKLKNVKGDPDSQWANIEVNEDVVTLTNNEIHEGIVPNVKGMGARSAIFLMENAGLQVRISGIGKVKKQSLTPGGKYQKGQTVLLTLG